MHGRFALDVINLLKVVENIRNSTLGFSDIQHYQKIILALIKMNTLMKEVDEVGDK
ncbi:MAG: hypothetical protein ACOH2V_10220 [Candidatus Saccharimonadaceae bacterium]